MAALSIKYHFTRPKPFNLFSRLIAFIDGVKFSHVAIEYTDTQTNQRLIAEASHGELHIVLYSNWIKHNEIVHTLYKEITWHEYIMLKMKVYRWSDNTKYGFLGVLGVGIALLFNLRFNIFRDKENTLFCSEAGAYVARDILKVDLEKSPELYSPRDIKELLEVRDEFHSI